MSKLKSTQNLRVRYEPTSIERDAFGQGHHLLGGVWPSLGAGSNPEVEGRLCLQPPMACLGGARHAQQWWRVDGPVSAHRSAENGGFDVTWTQTDEFLFATVSLADGPLEHQSDLAYQVLLKILQDRKRPNLLRIWNFVPRINALDGGIERYQLFNTGRRKAFRESGYTLSDGAPAACALGTHRGGLRVAMLAGMRPAMAIENPRQVSSYHYPKQYGTDAPIFSRAAWLPQPSGEDLLFISGTASIVGHQTLHAGDVLAQVSESVRNIEAVLSSANQRAGAPLWNLAGLKGRVYLRRAADYALVSAYVLARGMTQFCFLEADICREDLLVEIEAEGQTTHDL